MLDAFRYLLCSKLCWHNRPVPNCEHNDYTLGSVVHNVIRIASYVYSINKTKNNSLRARMCIVNIYSHILVATYIRN